VRVGGNTACVEIQAGPHTIILDAGTGIINLGADLMRRARAQGGHSITATILFSHMHNDHTQGFLRSSLCRRQHAAIHGPKVFESDLKRHCARHAPPMFPIALDDLPSHRRCCAT
jgi:metal-dependent hydrolase (beta-lactamase superfamily II)